MSELRAVHAVVRLELLDRVVQRLKRAGVPRMTVQRVHAIGAGVDPATARISLDEGTELAEKALIEFICPATDAEEFTRVVAAAAHTGRQGDGVVWVADVHTVQKIRTGVRGAEALQ